MNARFDLFASNFGGASEAQVVQYGRANGWAAVRKMQRYKPGTTCLFYSKFRACLVDHPMPRGMSLNVQSQPFDVSALEASAPPNSLFQVASNFHAFEQPRPNQSPESGTLDDVFDDHTQGPAAVLPTSLDLITRRYLLSTGEYTDAKLLSGQWPLDMLSKLHSRGVRITVGGWADISNAEGPQYANEAFDLAKCVGAVLVKDALVTHDERGRNISSRNQRVHQVLTSTLDTTMFDSRIWMNIFLVAAYINTLSAAKDLKASNVYLTLIGGGVFDNPLPCIFASMAIAFNTVDFSQWQPRFYVALPPGTAVAHGYCNIVQAFVGGRINLTQCLERISTATF